MIVCYLISTLEAWSLVCNCLRGPERVPTTLNQTCLSVDLDKDGDFDLKDFAAWSNQQH